MNRFQSIFVKEAEVSDQKHRILWAVLRSIALIILAGLFVPETRFLSLSIVTVAVMVVIFWVGKQFVAFCDGYKSDLFEAFHQEEK